MSENYYLPGAWNAICDICGFKFKSTELRENWKGLRVCDDDFEHRNMLDFPFVRVDQIGVPWTRLEVVDDPIALTGSHALGEQALGNVTLGM